MWNEVKRQIKLNVEWSGTSNKIKCGMKCNPGIMDLMSRVLKQGR